MMFLFEDEQSEKGRELLANFEGGDKILKNKLNHLKV